MTACASSVCSQPFHVKHAAPIDRSDLHTSQLDLGGLSAIMEIERQRWTSRHSPRHDMFHVKPRLARVVSTHATTFAFEGRICEQCETPSDEACGMSVRSDELREVSRETLQPRLCGHMRRKSDNAGRRGFLIDHIRRSVRHPYRRGVRVFLRRAPEPCGSESAPRTRSGNAEVSCRCLQSWIARSCLRIARTFLCSLRPLPSPYRPSWSNDAA